MSALELLDQYLRQLESRLRLAAWTRGAAVAAVAALSATVLLVLVANFFAFADTVMGVARFLLFLTLALAVAFGPDPRPAFEDAHRRLFGFVEADRTIVIASVEVESSPPLRGRGLGAGGDTAPVSGAVPPPPLPPPLKGEGDLILRPDTQIFVAPGWTASEEDGGLIRLTRTATTATRQATESSTPDPVTLEL